MYATRPAGQLNQRVMEEPQNGMRCGATGDHLMELTSSRTEHRVLIHACCSCSSRTCLLGFCGVKRDAGYIHHVGMDAFLIRRLLYSAAVEL